MTIVERIISKIDNDKEFIASRIKELGRNERRKILHEDTLFQPIIGGFFDDQMMIYPGPTQNSFSVDDSEVYSLLLEEIRRLNGQNTLCAVQYATTKYFNNVPTPAAELRIERNKLFEEPTAAPCNYSIASLQDKAACAERTAVAHNLLQFIGVESYYTGGFLREEGDNITGENDPHAFVLMKIDGNYLVYDPTNPIFCYDDSKLTKCVNYVPFTIDTGSSTIPVRGNVFSGDRIAKFRDADGKICTRKEGKRIFKIGI